MILNLKELNKKIQYHNALKIMTPGCYMASTDLRDAYYKFPTHPDHQKYLKFSFNGIPYTCLPNIFSGAPRIFTKLMKALRNQGHLKRGYIDDFHLQGNTVNKCSGDVQQTATLTSGVQFLLHFDKSVFTPTQNLIFLGFLLDSVRFFVALL